MKHVQAVVLRLAALLAALCLAGCGAAAPAGPVSGANAPAQEYVTFTDALGRQVSAPRSPQRVAALIGSFADIWCLAGGAEQLVATANDSWTSFDLPLRADTVNLGSSKEISLELLVASVTLYEDKMDIEVRTEGLTCAMEEIENESDQD